MAESIILLRRFYLPYIIYWVIWIVIQTSILQWFGIPGQLALADSVVTFLLLGIICIVVCNVLIYYQPGRDIMVYLLFLGGIATVIWGFSVKELLELLVYTGSSHQELMSKSLPVRYCIGFLNIGWMILITLFWKRMGSEQDARDKENDMLRISREAELYKLRQQLQPHFLFNSLNSINALIHSKPQEARKMVQQLSDFLRGTLKREDQQFVTFEEELEYLKIYLDIEKVRFGYRLNALFDTSADTLQSKIPPLVLQPLLENAIKFGLYGTIGEVEIRLKARMSDHYLVVSITNPYEPDMQTPRGTGFGLKSIRRRLHLLFGRDDLMETNQSDNTFMAAFRIPQYYDQSNNY